MGKPELLPCPFCGSTRLLFLPANVKCDDCKALGPRGGSEGTMLTRWNRRTAPTVKESLEAEPGTGKP